MTHKYPIEGPPGAGKSTLLARLSDLGFYTMKEVATYVKELRMSQGRPTAEEDRVGFQHEILYTQIRWEKEIPTNTPVAFLDRGLFSAIPYYEIDGLQAPQEQWDAAWNAHYAGIFYLQPGRPYKNTAVRPETRERALELGERTRTLYKKWGHSTNLLDIPPTTLDEQVLMVLDQVELGMNRTGKNEDYIANIRARHYPQHRNLRLEAVNDTYAQMRRR